MTDRHQPPATRPVTIAEQLDAAKDGEEFGQVLMGLFRTLDKARENDS